MTVTPQDRIDDIVDLDRYPIHDLGSPRGTDLVEQCRQAFSDDVSCQLPGFIRSDAVAELVAEIEQREYRAVLSSRYRSPYGTYTPAHDETPDDHAATVAHTAPQRRHVHYLAYDEFETNSKLHRLYESPAVAAFAAAVLDIPALYHAADPLMGAPVTFHYPDCELGWHCDTQEFTITALFRPSASGGEFQYVPSVGPDDENYARVPSILDGDEQLIRTVAFNAGDIIIFRGANTLHRVTRTTGGEPRLLAVLHYERTPGRIFDDQFKLDVFHRTEPRGSQANG